MVIDDRVSGREAREVDGISFITRPDLPAAIFTLNHFKPDIVILSRFEEDAEKLKLLNEQADRQSLPVVKLAEDLKDKSVEDLGHPKPEDLLSGKLNSLIRELISSRALKEDWEAIKGATEEQVEQSISLIDDLDLSIAVINENGDVLFSNRVNRPDLDVGLNPILLDHVRHLSSNGIRKSQFESEDGQRISVELTKLNNWQGNRATRVVVKQDYPKPEPNFLKPHHLGWEWINIQQNQVIDHSKGLQSILKLSTDWHLSDVGQNFIAVPEIDWSKNVGVSEVRLMDRDFQSELGQFELREVAARHFGYEGRLILMRRTNPDSKTTKRLSSEDLLHITSHDLREPIRVLLNYGQLLERRLKRIDDPELSEFARYMIESGKRMEVYLEQLKTLIRLGKQDDQAIVKLNQLIPEIEKKIRSSHSKDFVLNTSPDLPKIKGVPLEIDLLFYNLLSNAVKFSPSGSVIGVKFQDLGSTWLFTISDSGKGIPEAYVDNIFEVSKRLEFMGSPESAGLGLSICKSIVDSAAGKIWIESREGHGTTVFVSWPKESH